MTRYYENLLDAEAALGRHEGLRQAQLALLAEPETRHPYYWAAFIASGDWRPINR